MYKVLDLGSGSHNRLSDDYKDWERVTLDINPNHKPDICIDIRNIDSREEFKEEFDAVFCSHVLEHFTYLDIPKVLKSIKYVLKKDGWLEILVPDLMEVMTYIINERVDIDHPLYQVGGRDIRAIDIIYGLGNTNVTPDFQNSFMEHKYGFSRKSLVQELHRAGFNIVDDYSQPGVFEIRMIAYP